LTLHDFEFPQNGQLKMVATFGRAFFGGGLAFLRLPLRSQSAGGGDRIVVVPRRARGRVTRSAVPRGSVARLLRVRCCFT